MYKENKSLVGNKKAIHHNTKQMPILACTRKSLCGLNIHLIIISLTRIQRIKKK